MRLRLLTNLLLGGLVARSAAVTVTVNRMSSHSIPSTLCYPFFANHIKVITSGDGGLYAELLQNRAFQQVTPNTSAALTAWHALSNAQLTVIADSHPVSNSLPNSLQFSVPSGSSGGVGFTNEGFWGIKVDSSWTYKASFFYRFPASSSFSGTLTAGLRTNGGTILAQTTTQIRGTATSWTQVNLDLKPTLSAADNDNSFFISVDGAAAAGQTINFAMLSLFPPTFKDRPNGMRLDIAETLAEMGPAFFRFPGGNNLGQTPATRWQWNATVGSLLDRPGRVGDWGYVNTDGLGLLEYLEFFEDVGMEPIMAVWSGEYFFRAPEPESALAGFIQQAKDQINFVIGDPASSIPAALRASLGHPEPFSLRFVEIGNEVVGLRNRYTYRWRDFFGNLTAEFPEIRFLATSDVGSPVLSPAAPAYDVHVYQTPTWFYQNAFYYDSFARDGTTYFEGEYAAISTNPNDLFGAPSDGRLLWPTVSSSAGEAAFMTGLERNSDIVFAASYAPLLQHVNSTQWTPDLISFDAGSVIKSTSFYVQKLFATNLGNQYLPSTLPTNGGTLHWSVTRSSTSGETFIKVANAGTASASITFDLTQFSTVASSGTLQLLTGADTASNTPAAPQTVVPQSSTITTGRTFTYNAPAFSVSVITTTTH
ncbi:glycoside hydrolase family 51 protein [Ganoderma leucocontextum]|nr:glycoside hydrolase family 51 protein [Ganoderma leucocontextum]